MNIKEIHSTEVIPPQDKKIIDYISAIRLINELQRNNQIVVFASGVFDVLHSGHLAFLRGAKSAGDKLIVGVESDGTVKLNKGDNRPLNDTTHRVQFLSELISTDYVFPFEDTVRYTNKEPFIRRFTDLHPDFVAFSTTENKDIINIKLEQIQEAGLNAAIISDPKYSLSTSKILKLMGYNSL